MLKKGMRVIRSLISLTKSNSNKSKQSKTINDQKIQKVYSIIMMKQFIAVLLFSFLSITTARRSSPLPAVPTYKDVHRMGWGLDEEYIEPSECDYEAVKPVKRVVVKKEYEKGQQNQKDTKPTLWGVLHVSDLDDLIGME